MGIGGKKLQMKNSQTWTSIKLGATSLYFQDGKLLTISKYSK